jgi:hypothetical protein
MKPRRAFSNAGYPAALRLKAWEFDSTPLFQLVFIRG